ncbi:MAG TPA: aldo/keto reductase [Anaerolineaceae bacterium]|nr:aldo/keto reductase [Anaerolineaceae bacterium]
MNDDFSRHTTFLDEVQMGVGAWAWGDSMFWGYGRGYAKDDVRDAFRVSLENQITFFDTAEIYGQGHSEQLLGQFIAESDAPKIYVASKFMPFPWRLTRGTLLSALKKSLERLRLPAVDLYQMHQPLAPVRIETWMEAMADACQQGLIRSIGVSNYDRSQTQDAYDALNRLGIRLASNQVEYHLLNRKIERSGLWDQCSQLGIKIIAYSPLAMGILSGKYSPQNPPGGFRSGRYGRQLLERIEPLLAAMRKIGSDRGGKTPAQIAINWVLCKGAVPIPGAKNARQAEENAGALGWRLTEAEVARLDELSDRVMAAR